MRLLAVLAFTTLLFLVIDASHAAKRVALVIGNSKYTTAPLKNPANDAIDISRTLSSLKFDVIPLTNANKRQMIKAINTFSGRLKEAEIGLFYYAGHGMQLNGNNFLIPTEVDVTSASDVEYEAIHAGRVLGKMEEAGNKLNIIILDACRNNPFRSSFRSGMQGLAKMDAPSGSILAYATSPGAVAQDGTGRNGVYTKHLLKAFNTQNLTIQELFNAAGLGVMEETGEKQVPWYSSSPMRPLILNNNSGNKQTKNKVAYSMKSRPIDNQLKYKNKPANSTSGLNETHESKSIYTREEQEAIRLFNSM